MKMTPSFFLVLLLSLLASAVTPHAQSQPVEIIPRDLHGAIQPQVAVASTGRIHVVFGKGTTIYHTASSDGRSFSAPVKVGELEKLALGMRRGPRIAASDKTLVITAISHSDGNIHAWVSTDGGATWQEKQKVNDSDKSAREGLHNMAGDGKGFVFATWLDLRDKGTEIWGASSQDGGATWSANALIYKSPDGHVCECCHPSVAVDAQGHVEIMWRNWLGGSRDLFLVTSNDRGRTFGVPQKLGEGTWKLNACPMDGGSIALTAKGDVVTAWRREKTVFAATATKEQRLADSGSQPVALATSKGISYLWQNGSDLMLQTQEKPPVLFANRAHMAAGAPLPNGGAVVVWETGVGSDASIMADILH